jgi:hypothetical protein
MDTIPRNDVDEALKHIGTNAFPVLLRMLRQQDSPVVLRLVQLAQKQRFVPVRYIAASVRHRQAVYGFGMLRVYATNAVPDLIKIYEANISTSSQGAVAIILAEMGPGTESALPALLLGLVGTDETAVANAIYAILHVDTVHPHSALVVPALINCLHHSSGYVRANAAMALGHYGPAAHPALSNLLMLSTDPDNNVRGYAIDAIKRIDPGTAVKYGLQ